MCLILAREPKVELPYENVKHAVLNNPDGWGYIIPDRGKLEIRRHFNPKGTDPDDVYGVLEDNPDSHVFLHLRFCTAGSKNKDNVHPFPALTQRKDGMQVWLMHNGTVNEFKPAAKDHFSDTYHFTDKVVTPLLRRVVGFTGKKALLQDPFVNQVIEKFANNWSKFLLVDNYGNFTTVGEGVQKEGYWLSNEYSFTPRYREPVKKNTYYHGGAEYSYEDWPPKKTYSYPTANAPKPALAAPAPAPQPDIEDVEYEEVAKDLASPSPFGPLGGDGEATASSTEKDQPPVPTWPDEKKLELVERAKFHEMLGLESYHDLKSLNEQDILDMVTEYPEVMTVLIQDLIWELDNRGKK
jgi:hypothetical protein